MADWANPDFVLKDRRSDARQKAVVATLDASRADPTLRKCLAIVDAKALHDFLSKETAAGRVDRRAAIEAQIVRQSLEGLGGTVRWCDHPAMVADALAKKGGNSALARHVLQTGRYGLVPAADILARHATEGRSSRSRMPEARHKGMKNVPEAVNA